MLFSKYSSSLIIILLASLSSFSQISFDEGDAERPLKKLHTSLYPELKAPVQSFIHIIDKDTITKSYFDKSGRELMKYEEFRKGKPMYKYVSENNGKLKTEMNLFIKDTLHSTTTYRYDKNRNLIEWKNTKTVYDNKAGTSAKVYDVHWKTEYDNNSRVKVKYAIDATGAKTLSYHYNYDSLNRIVEIDEVQWKNKYEHNGRLVIRKYRIFKNDNSTFSSYDYKYNNDSLLIESSDKNYTSEYKYNDGKILKQFLYKKKGDTTYKQIDFFYNENLLNKAEITSNDLSMNYATPGFIFNTNYLYSFRKNELYKMKMEFLYDKFKNVVEIKYFVKDEYKYSQYFIYKYY